MNCIYCEEPIKGNKKSREHVIPQWIIKKLKIQKIPLSFAGISRNLEITKPITPVPNTFVHMICSQCNNGWLSKIDNSCIELLGSMMVPDKEAESPSFTEDSIHKLYILIYKIFLNYFATSPESYRQDKLIYYKNFYENKYPLTGTEFFLSLVPAEENFSITHLDYWMALEILGEGITEADFPQNRSFSFKFFIQLGSVAFVLCNSGTERNPTVYDPSILDPLIIKNSTFSQVMQIRKCIKPIPNTSGNLILSNALRISLTKPFH